MFDTPDFDLAPYADLDTGGLVRRTHCSWHAAGWQSLLVQCFTHAREVESFALPGVADLHLVLAVGGEAVMRVRDGAGTGAATSTGAGAGRAVRRRWAPGRLELMVPGHPTTRSYRAASASAMRSIQVHVPRATVERIAAELGGPAPDFAAIGAELAAGDEVVEQVVRALPAAGHAGDLYAESAAAFLVTHLLSRGRAGREQRLPGPEHRAVRAGLAIMRERLADPLTLADIAGEVHLSVYHFVRVFRDATGQTPHRYLTGLRIERARRLLSGTGLTVAQIAERCGFSGPGSLSSAFLAHVGVRPSAYRAYSGTDRNQDSGSSELRTKRAPGS
ncbi:helix-turn-helix domain-containing protein [Streptomyces sp. NRRL S-340]|uniref:helix-turn-helix domain-containing protein n=1 Tax=Streptomyces sp. NRRL S-340 TaxID=1463901 RepID=UPI00055F2421|nr:AraC family transcriptional regulator [Streptomyces sp. NRRL S-340]